VWPAVVDETDSRLFQVVLPGPALYEIKLSRIQLNALLNELRCRRVLKDESRERLLNYLECGNAILGFKAVLYFIEVCVISSGSTSRRAGPIVSEESGLRETPTERRVVT